MISVPINASIGRSSMESGDLLPALPEGESLLASLVCSISGSAITSP